MSLKVKIIIGLVSFLVLLGVSAMVYNWFSVRFKPVTSQSSYVSTPEIKKVTNIVHKKVQVIVPIDTIDKDEAVKKLGVNDPIKSDKDKQIITTAEIQPYEGKTNVISVLNTKDGTSEIVAKQVPLSFLGFENKKEAYIEGGYNTKGNVEIGLGAQWQFARVANAKIGIVGEIRGSQDDTMGFAGLRITYTFK